MTIVVRPTMVDDSGVFTDGTAVTKSFIDSLLDTVDDQVHSVTNPTIKPKATTDEVVAARGSKASVDARLDVALNEDGTLRSLTDASAAVSGVVNLSAQTLGQGLKKVQAGSGTGLLSLGGVINVNNTPASNVGVAETDLMSYTVPANTLNANGKVLRIMCWGVLANNANTKVLRGYWGGVLLNASMFNAAIIGHKWQVTIYIARTGAATQRWTFGGLTAAAVAAASNPFADEGTGAVDTSLAAIFKLTGLSLTAGGDLTQNSMIVEVLG